MMRPAPHRVRRGALPRGEREEHGFFITCANGEDFGAGAALYRRAVCNYPGAFFAAGAFACLCGGEAARRSRDDHSQLLSAPASPVWNSFLLILATIIRGYVALMRGTPLMLQLFFIYFGLPVLPVVGEYLVMGRFPAACVAFVLNYAAYFCEIFRGGLLAVDRGQYEAAQVLGLRRLRTKLTIAVPQMCKVTLPAVSNEVITLVKDTALGSVLSIPDLMKLATARVNATATDPHPQDFR